VTWQKRVAPKRRTLSTTNPYTAFLNKFSLKKQSVKLNQPDCFAGTVSVPAKCFWVNKLLGYDPNLFELRG
jgi:hypothetical protein